MSMYKGFDRNTVDSLKPWGAREQKCIEDIIDTLVTGTINGAANPGGHRHSRLYDQVEGEAAFVYCNNNAVTVGGEVGNDELLYQLSNGAMPLIKVLGNGSMHLVGDVVGGTADAVLSDLDKLSISVADGNNRNIVGRVATVQGESEFRDFFTLQPRFVDSSGCRGGLKITGTSWDDVNTQGVYIVGTKQEWVGEATPDQSDDGVITLAGFDVSATGATPKSVADANILLSVFNNNKPAIKLLGNGSLHLLGTSVTDAIWDGYATENDKLSISVNANEQRSIVGRVRNPDEIDEYNEFFTLQTFGGRYGADQGKTGGLLITAKSRDIGVDAFTLEANSISGVEETGSVIKFAGMIDGGFVPDTTSLLEVDNYNLPVVTILGNGNIGVRTRVPSAGIEIFDMSATDKINTGILLTSEDADHGMTTIAETDAYGVIRRARTAYETGSIGLEIIGIAGFVACDSDIIGLHLKGITLAGLGMNPTVLITGSLKSGTGDTHIASGEAIFGINNYTSSLIKVLGNGSMHLVGDVVGGTIDASISNLNKLSISVADGNTRNIVGRVINAYGGSTYQDFFTLQTRYADSSGCSGGLKITAESWDTNTDSFYLQANSSTALNPTHSVMKFVGSSNGYVGNSYSLLSVYNSTKVVPALDLLGGGHLAISGDINIHTYSAASAPTLYDDGYSAYWIDSDDSNRVYLMYRRGAGDQVKVELTTSATSAAPDYPEYTFFADQMMTPMTSDWVYSAGAPLSPDNVNDSIPVRVFTSATISPPNYPSVGFMIHIPANAPLTNNKLIVYADVVVRSINGGNGWFGLDPYFRAIINTSAVGGWTTASGVGAVTITNNYFTYGRLTIDMGVGGAAYLGRDVQIELTRGLGGTLGTCHVSRIKFSFT